jgi:hypothetical protein
MTVTCHGRDTEFGLRVSPSHLLIHDGIGVGRGALENGSAPIEEGA